MQANYDSHPLDLSYLIQMVGQDPGFMIEVFDTFINQTPFYIAELEDAISIRDWDRVANCAHKIKPTFSYIGRKDVKEVVERIEHNACHKHSQKDIETDLKVLKQTIKGIYLQLEHEKRDLLRNLY